MPVSVNNCKTCAFWEPKVWNGIDFIDPFATCAIHKGYYPEGHERAGFSITKKPDDSCTNYKLIKVRNFVKRHEASQLVQKRLQVQANGSEYDTVDLIEAMDKWYEDNKHQYLQTQDVGQDEIKAGGKVAEGYLDMLFHPDSPHSYSEEEQRILRICLQPSTKGDELFIHQIEDFIRFKDVNPATNRGEFGCYLEQGLGKSAINLRIAAYMYLKGMINALIVVAPNDVHVQWACIGGDTIVTYTKSKPSNKIKSTIRDLYHRFNGIGAYNKRYADKPCKVYALIDGYFRFIDVKKVLYNGVKPVVRIKTASGKQLVCTRDHRILTTRGYIRADELIDNEILITNGINCCGYCGKELSYHKSICASCAKLKSLPNNEYVNKRGYIIVTGAQTLGHYRRKHCGGVYKHRWVMAEYLGRNLSCDEYVHHIDGNLQNNELSNLKLVVGHSAHAKEHYDRNIKNLLRPDGLSVALVTPKQDHILDIEDFGFTDVYDIACENPHNFVANGIVVHNCEQIPLWLPPEIPREVQCFGGRSGAKDTVPFNYPDYLHVVCVNIDTFSTPNKWKDIVEWAKIKKTMIILDEATSIKNPSSKRAERMLYEFNDVVRVRKTIKSSVPKTVARAVLTGTPVTNGVVDLWSLKEFLRPNYFGRNWYSFRNRYTMLAAIVTPYGSTQVPINQQLWEGIKNCDTYERAYMVFGVTHETYETVKLQDKYQGAYKHEQELKDLIAPISSFRILTECVDMPPQVYNKKTVQLSDEQRRAYKSMEAELLAMYGGATTTAANKLSAMVRLQQISSGFIVQGNLDLTCYDSDDDTTWWGGENEPDIEPGQVQWLGGNIPKLDALYRDIGESSHPCIVITRFSAEASRIFDDLSRDYKCLLYTGWKKTGTIEEFQNGKYEILVANIRCVSRGFNLQNSHQMFFYSNTFSLEDRLQTESRIFRIGQKNTCIYTDYINENTIDLKVVGALRQKRALLDYIRGSSLEAFIKEEDEIIKMEGVV